MNKFDTLFNEILSEKKSTKVDVKVKMENDDSYITSFNIPNDELEVSTPEEVVRKYFVGKSHAYSDESSSRIVSAEII